MTGQSRMFQHEDLPLFSGAAPSDRHYNEAGYRPATYHRQLRLEENMNTFALLVEVDDHWRMTKSGDQYNVLKTADAETRPWFVVTDTTAHHLNGKNAMKNPPETWYSKGGQPT